MLADVLREQGRRPSWVAEKLGVSPATVTLWSQGKRDIPARRVRELAALLGVDELQVGSGVTDAQDIAPSARQRQQPAPESGLGGESADSALNSPSAASQGQNPSFRQVGGAA